MKILATWCVALALLGGASVSAALKSPRPAHQHLNPNSLPYSLTDNASKVAGRMLSRSQIVAKLQPVLNSDHAILQSLKLSSWAKHLAANDPDIKDHEIHPNRQVWIAKVTYPSGTRNLDFGEYGPGAVATIVWDVETGAFLMGDIRGKRLRIFRKI